MGFGVNIKELKMNDAIVVIGLICGCYAIFQLGRCYELLREIRARNDELEAKMKRN